ncbi:recombination mediator RecR [Campylobacter corcagiensis]|uniref:Recombination protein RecR n=1 Tax=Campylobacter corcagiensis TaxID=1448857 RepID=A0A7M1LHD1_9BACT|nr:recombination mediator RecR [Campylobacter corcagiensis]QKF64357.1 recombination protein [Campylobacter corcagiensis]QOQ87454.1 recombination protein RecR [Campylobacter corcagiensis]
MSSKFDELVEAFSKLPGVGKKSALKYAYHVSIDNSFAGLNLAHCIEDAVKALRRCENCGAISEDEICEICADSSRDSSTLCIVENPKDILILEKSGAYKGLYFVLDDINSDIVEKLINFTQKNSTNEILFAMTPGINSDGIMLYIEDKFKGSNILFSKIAQGIPTGVTLDNIDTLSLTKAINDRREI